MVFEDDVLPIKANLPLLKNAIEELPDDWDLVYFGYTKHETITDSLKRKRFFYKLISPFRLIKWTPVMVRNMLPRKFSKHLKRAGYHDCTHAYAISGTIAEKLVKRQQPVVFKADNLLSYLILNEEIRGFVVEPQFFSQENHLDPQHPSMIQ